LSVGLGVAAEAVMIVCGCKFKIIFVCTLLI
jgi:hypothetical protein